MESKRREVHAASKAAAQAIAVRPIPQEAIRSGAAAAAAIAIRRGQERRTALDADKARH